jgi:hypothetical protein
MMKEPEMNDNRDVPTPTASSPQDGKKEDRSKSFGCVLLGLGFLVVGLFLLWMFFSGAPTKRGNPLMGLVGGAVFALVGLMALASGLAGLFRRKS